MKITPLEIPDVLLIEHRVFADERGFFLESFHRARFGDAGLPTEFVQDNHSRSRARVLRGLHYQLHQPQGKLVRVVRGEVFDVAVDIRRGSPTFGRWVGHTLSEDRAEAMYIPPGFAHGFSVLSDVADFTYKCTALYAPEDERGLVWNDPTLAIDWPIDDPCVSAKDRAFRRIDEATDDLPLYAPAGVR